LSKNRNLYNEVAEKTATHTRTLVGVRRSTAKK